MSFQYDLNGNRTRVTWPDGFYAGYVYDALDRVTAVNENGATSGVGVLATYSYDSRGRRTGLTRGNTTTTSWSYDTLDRLTGLTHDLAGTAYDQSSTFTFSPASQLTSKTETNTVYLWTNYPSDTASTWDGLNRDAAVAAMNPPTCPTTTLPTNAGYDCNGNQLQDAAGVRHFTYDAESRLLTTSGLPTNLALSYDPTGRLQQTQASGGSTATTLFLYEGSRLIAEYDTSGNVLQRYVHGPSVDEPIVWYEGSGTTTRHFLHTDRQGSVIALSDSSGAETATYAYGPYGEPQAWGGSRFSYTGQIQLPEAKLYYYKARIYDPASGRFLQTDPIGYKDDLDWYAYVGGDPVNKTDPTGLAGCASDMSTGDCNAALAAQAQARKDIANTQSALNNLTKERAAVASGSQKELSAGASATQANLQKSFGDSGASTVKSVQSSLSKIDGVLADNGSKYQFSHSNIGNNYGQAVPIFGSKIQLGGPFFSTTPRNQIVTVIHEPAHIVVPAGDFGYEGANRWEPTWMHLHNADDIAIFTHNTGH